MIGFGHPYTWGAKEPEVLANTAAGPGPAVVITTTFETAAMIHAKNWGSNAIKQLVWVGGNDNELEAEWAKMMGWSKSVWAEKRAGGSGLIVSPAVIEVIDAAFEKLSWADHLSFKAGARHTLIQGDFHPYNAMWMGSDRPVVLYDWEMTKVSVSSRRVHQITPNVCARIYAEWPLH